MKTLLREYCPSTLLIFLSLFCPLLVLEDARASPTHIYSQDDGQGKTTTNVVKEKKEETVTRVTTTITTEEATSPLVFSYTYAPSPSQADSYTLTLYNSDGTVVGDPLTAEAWPDDSSDSLQGESYCILGAPVIVSDSGQPFLPVYTFFSSASTVQGVVHTVGPANLVGHGEAAQNSYQIQIDESGQLASATSMSSSAGSLVLETVTGEDLEEEGDSDKKASDEKEKDESDGGGRGF